MTIYLAPSSRIKDVVIDSGSEATQMAMFERNSANQSINDICPIFEDVYRYFNVGNCESDAIKSDAKNYIQAEVDGNITNDKLYKSQFFVKKDNTKEEIDTFNILANSEERNNLGVFLMMLHKGDLSNNISTQFITF